MSPGKDETRPTGGHRISVKALRTVATGGVEKRTFGNRALHRPTVDHWVSQVSQMLHEGVSYRPIVLTVPAI
jgi:hypothetical protein